MKFPFAEKLAVKRWQTSGLDRYGDPISEWVTLADPVLAMVADQAAVAAFSPGRIEFDFDFALYLEPGQTVIDSDLLTVRGKDCKVVKPHFEWINGFTGDNPGATVYVKAEVG